MVVRALARMAVTVLLGTLALPQPAAAQGVAVPPRKVEINKLTCQEFSSVGGGEERDRILIYMNGYLDGTRKATHWDAEQVAPRIEAVVRICRDNPKLTLLDAFKRAWKR